MLFCRPKLLRLVLLIFLRIQLLEAAAVAVAMSWLVGCWRGDLVIGWLVTFGFVLDVAMLDIIFIGFLEYILFYPPV